MIIESKKEIASGYKILIIDDDEGMSYTLVRMVEEAGHSADVAFNLKKGLEKAVSGNYDVIFLDVRLPDGNGLDIIPDLRSIAFPPEIIIITAYGEKGGADLALKSGAWDYLDKPSNIGTMELSLTRALQYRSQKQVLKTPLTINRTGIIGSNPKLLMCITLMAHAAKSDANVLIGGETGTGKELFAKAIHLNSMRNSKPFIVVDCTSLPRNLAESILFGHVKGAFTGADSSHDGLVKQADQGTLFLDEIGELPKTLQKKLLRVLQERLFRPVGGKTEIKSNFRLISATNKDLEAMVESESFRQDLLFRLRTFVIELPPIRGRHKDIKDLASHYTEKICRNYHFDKKELSDDFLDTLFTYKWPGNVREFVSSMESAVAMGSHSRTLFSKHLPNYIRIQALGSANRECDQEITCTPTQKMVTLKDFRQAALAQAEKEYLKSLIKNTVWNVKTACRTSGLRRARLYQLLKKYDIKK
ncbi:MAG: sigma-54 dependent transcriptional regulator [Desulfobacula sp.]|uniref:sigma-54-dependent transcriptional regulator n=1 Tax=Desulfobacula sp. TaxID=2593537 RepID=UPI0025BFE76E|nr:sigma-54 dependent transcriptional regulator [Desulfobacula sp.]MCD4721101.1 sigma-54 dependent transcriptional regulator [Desulfobacula sp.]